MLNLPFPFSSPRFCGSKLRNFILLLHHLQHIIPLWSTLYGFISSISIFLLHVGVTSDVLCCNRAILATWRFCPSDGNLRFNSLGNVKLIFTATILPPFQMQVTLKGQWGFGGFVQERSIWRLHDGKSVDIFIAQFLLLLWMVGQAHLNWSSVTGFTKSECSQMAVKAHARIHRFHRTQKVTPEIYRSRVPTPNFKDGLTAPRRHNPCHNVDFPVGRRKTWRDQWLPSVLEYCQYISTAAKEYLPGRWSARPRKPYKFITLFPIFYSSMSFDRELVPPPVDCSLGSLMFSIRSLYGEYTPWPSMTFFLIYNRTTHQSRRKSHQVAIRASSCYKKTKEWTTTLAPFDIYENTCQNSTSNTERKFEQSSFATWESAYIPIYLTWTT